MPITREQAIALAELLTVVRPNWNTRGIIKKGLAPLARHPAPLEVIAWAALRAAANRENLTPAVIPLNGPHWNLADRPPDPRLTPENECPRHPGKWADLCPLCHADKLGHAYYDPEDPPDSRNARQRARDAARAARDRHLYDEDDQPDQKPPTEAPPAYGTPEHARAHHDKHPERVGLGPDARRRAAAATAGDKLEARRTGQLCETKGCGWPFEDHDHAVDPVPISGGGST